MSMNSGCESSNNEMNPAVDSTCTPPPNTDNIVISAEETTATIYGEAKTSVWWDIENCGVPRGCDPHFIAQHITTALHNLQYTGPVSISAYGDTHSLSLSIQHALNSTGVTLNHVPPGIKDASDKKILVDMLLWATDNPAPANFLLISGDPDFAYALHHLRMRRYNILLAQPSHVSTALVSAANNVWLWTSLVNGCPPLNATHSSSSLNYRDSNDNNNNLIAVQENGVNKKRKAASVVYNQEYQNHKKARNFFLNKKGNSGGIIQTIADALKDKLKQNGNFKKGKSLRVYMCKKCPINHPGRDCLGNIVQCNNCGKLGHRKFECNRKPMNQQNQPSPANKNDSCSSQPSVIPKANEQNAFKENLNGYCNENCGNLLIVQGNGVIAGKDKKRIAVARDAKFQRGKCSKCLVDHNGRDCKGNLIRCFYCNEYGHKRYECSSKVMNPSNIFNNQVTNIPDNNEGNVNSIVNNDQSDGQVFNKNHVQPEQENTHVILPVSVPPHDGRAVAMEVKSQRGVCKKCLLDHKGRDCQGNLIQCFNCWEYGHIKFQCFRKPMKPSHNNQVMDIPDNSEENVNAIANNVHSDGQIFNKNHVQPEQGNTHVILPVLVPPHDVAQGGAEKKIILGDPVSAMNHEQITPKETSSNRGLFRGVQCIFKTLQVATKSVSKFATG